MSRGYSVYGLRVLADGHIPGLLPSDISDCIDVRIWLNRMPTWWNRESETGGLFYRSQEVDERERARLTVWKLQRSGWYHIVYHDGTEFLVDPQGGEIWCTWPESATLEDTATYLIGPVFGFVLRLRGVCCLHASAVGIGETIIAFTGPARAGKSTTAAAFAKQGYPVVSDDIVALVEADDGFLVRPGYPRLCLWPDVEIPLYGSSRTLPQITEGWPKRYLDLTSGDQRFQLQSRPLSAIYLLEERMDAANCPKVEAVSQGSAMVKLTGNTYMNYLLDRNLRSQEFPFLSRLVSKVPVRRVVPHKDPASLPRLCEAILEDYAVLPKSVGTVRGRAD